MHVYIISKEKYSSWNEGSKYLKWILYVESIHDTDSAKIRHLTQENISWLISQIETKTWSEF